MAWTTRIIAAPIFATLLAAITAPVQAQETRLDCEMTDYSGGTVWNSWSGSRSDNLVDVRKLIPERTVHIIDGASARIEGSDHVGSYRREGRQRQIKYTTRVPVLGKAEITYTYIISSGLITARVLFPQKQQNLYIDRIAGTCKRQG